MEKLDFICHVGFDELHEIGTTLKELISILDKNDVKEAVLSPIGEGWIHKFKEQNRNISKISIKSNSRFIFFCSVNPWFEEEALNELKICFKELGAKGVVFNTVRQGLYIDSPMIFPFIEMAELYKKPVYFYTGTPIYGLPLNLANLALKYPKVHFILGTMGATDYWGDVIPCVRMANNIYIETSLNTNVPAVLPGFVKEFGADKLLFGTNFPYSNYRLECEKILKCNFSREVNKNIFSLNAKELISLD